MMYLEFISQIWVIVILILSLVFLSGIVWRVEMKLDVSYKLFLLAIAFLLVSEIEKIVALEAAWFNVVGFVCKFLFAAFFFWGVMEMRSLIRDLDGERKK